MNVSWKFLFGVIVPVCFLALWKFIEIVAYIVSHLRWVG